MTSIRLLALDIDGTSLTSEGEFSARNRSAIERARQAGVKVVLVTGRRFGSARALLHEIELDLPLVSHNGALTKDVETLRTIDYHPLERDIAREVVLVGRSHGIDLLCCDDPHGLGKVVIEGISETNLAQRRYLERYREAVVKVTDLVEYLDHSPIQMMFSGPCDPMDHFADHLTRLLAGRIQIFKTRYRSSNLTILDALSLTASKGASLAAMAQLDGLDRSQVMAIGDNHNDLSMLRYAGVSVVMANADEELRQMEFAVTASNSEDGVALAIDKFIFGGDSAWERQADNHHDQQPKEME